VLTGAFMLTGPKEEEEEETPFSGGYTFLIYKLL
jgi:hypothetical protein